VRPEGLGQFKISTSSLLDPATFRFVHLSNIFRIIFLRRKKRFRYCSRSNNAAREVITLYSENRTKPVKTLRGHNEFLMLEISEEVTAITLLQKARF
jgi:hypothetical protein